MVRRVAVSGLVTIFLSIIMALVLSCSSSVADEDKTPVINFYRLGWMRVYSESNLNAKPISYFDPEPGVRCYIVPGYKDIVMSCVRLP